MTFTLVSFHAHPDDEALLTGGTLARAAAEGHRVVIVTATDGDAGLTSDKIGRSGDLGALRLQELEQSAKALGVHRVVALGYPDGRFSSIDTGVAAARLAAVLEEESADVLTTYDPAGGYGHPDHVHVHHVGREAARLAGTPVVLEATIDRRLLLAGLRMMSLLPRRLRVDRGDFASAYSATADITHRVDVSRHLDAKKRALAAHHSQAVGGRKRTVAFLLGLPSFATGLVLGREWFVEENHPRTGPMCDDIFSRLR